ncbi:MAG TPA: NepR family anti-sigma factor [Sphingobium sp.]
MSAGQQGSGAGQRAPGDVGQLLRGAYRQTVDEAIPDDLMDLLNKLE